MNVVYGLLLLLLPLSSLLARRLPISQTLKMVAGWIGIFGLVFVVGLYRNEFRSIWDRARAELSSDGIAAEGGALRIRKRDDGHFWVNASINGKSVRFMVDSGATVTTICKGDAVAAGLTFPPDHEMVEVSTANGVANTWPSQAEAFAVGPIERSAFPMLIATRDDDTNLLGMNFLSTLKSWRVEGDQMILTP